jgi:hypothetical protein
MLEMNECIEDKLCVDCEDTNCIFAKKIISDCPKYYCDREEDDYEDCETCEFIKEFQKYERERLKNERSLSNELE